MKALEAGDRLAAEARERAEKATKGPWESDRLCIQAPDGNVGIVNLARSSKVDVDFISDARQSVPALCAEVERRGEAIRHIPHCGVCLVDLKYHDRFCPEVAAILEGK